MNTTDSEEVTQPIDLGSVRMRATLGIDRVSYEIKEDQYGSTMIQSNKPGSYIAYDSKADQSPSILNVANTYKPSDLDCRRLTQPIGVSGVMTVEDLLKRASVVTGLKLQLTGSVGNRPVFVGVETMPVGDALDGMRLCLCSSFRLLGDTYLLCWDRRGVAALEQMMADGMKNGEILRGPPSSSAP